MTETLTSEEWLALRRIARGVEARRIPKLIRLRLKAMQLVTSGRDGLVLTEVGKKLLLLGDKPDSEAVILR